MRKPNKIEREINTIRTTFYEKTKGMSPSEMNTYIKEQVAPVHKKYGIQTVSEVKSGDPHQTAV